MSSWPAAPTSWNRRRRTSGQPPRVWRCPSPATLPTPPTAERVVQAAVDNFGGVDVMVNNAGRSNAKAFESVSDDDWGGDFDLKVWAAVRFIRAVIPHMRKAGGGRIINVTNLGGRAPGPASMPTSVSRAAGIAITKALSKDLARDNILVSTVCIGTIKSGQTQRFYAGRKEADPGLTMDGYWAEIAQRQNIPLGRVGEAKEAGDVITFPGFPAGQLSNRHSREHRRRRVSGGVVISRMQRRQDRNNLQLRNNGDQCLSLN